MQIDKHTRIAALIRANERTIETLIGVSARFEKLRNPVLRKIMAGQVSLAQAARVGGVSLDALFDALRGIGFLVADAECVASASAAESDAADPAGDARAQAAERELKREFAALQTIHDFDARELIAAGEEPLSDILRVARAVLPGEGLRVINSFPPEPLLDLLARRGFRGWIEALPDRYEARFLRFAASATDDETLPEPAEGPAATADARPFVVRIDVRGLKPPEPMMRILSTLAGLNARQRLYVFHERIPRFLLPELAEQNYVVQMRERGEGDLRLLIRRRTV
jgi:uncharacterized protein (DUF2249 family)